MSPVEYFGRVFRFQIFGRRSFPGLLSFRPGTGTGATVGYLDGDRRYWVNNKSRQGPHR